MILVNGKYNTATIFADVVDDSAIEQVRIICDQKFVEGSKIRLMPDIHAGTGCTIGMTMTIKDKIVPNLVGVDIGCGMLTVKLEDKGIDLDALDSVIHKCVPSGTSTNDTPHFYYDHSLIRDLYCINHVDVDRASLSIGTLGGGNHFIEIDKDESGDLYLVIHTGSRHLGGEVAKYYQKEAWRVLKSKPAKDLIDALKAAGRHKEIETELKKLKAESSNNMPSKEFAYVTEELFNDYIHDMKIVQEFARVNRRAIAKTIVDEMGLWTTDIFQTIHNYIDTDAMILRKGAVSAKAGEKMLIPINMRDGSLICIGKGNHEWNCSAPHGAGRLMSRTAARNTFTVEEFKEQMKGVYSTSVCEDTIDECPMAYKGMQDILRNIGDTAEVVNIIRPIYNFKAKE